MRVLFSCVASYGHFHPLVPLARAFVREGHDVAFATAEGFRDRVEDAGFELLPAGIDQAEVTLRHQAYREELLSLPPLERRPFAFTTRFGLIDAPAKVPALLEAASAWGPDLLVHDSADLAGPIAAAALDVPSAHQSFGRMVPLACFERAAGVTAELWHGEPEPLCGAFRGLYLDICPPSFQSSRPPADVRVAPLRPLFPPSPNESQPAWLDEPRERPLVYVTLGTVHGDVFLFRTLLDALADVDCDVVTTVGRAHDPAALGPVPANARVEQYVSQAYVLPHCAAVVAHGGSGSILAAFAHGLPSLLVPQGADQFENGVACAELGAGLVLMPGEVTVDSVRAAVVELLGQPRYRVRAMRLAAEIAAMPEPREVVPQLLDAVT